MIPSSEISFQTLTVHGAISSTLLWALSPRKEANFTLLPKQKAPPVRYRLCPNKGRLQVREAHLSWRVQEARTSTSVRLSFLVSADARQPFWERTECQTALPSIQMLPTAADGYTLRFFSGFQDFISPRPQLPKRPAWRTLTSGDSMLPEEPRWVFTGLWFFPAVSLQQVISVNDCSCFLDDVWKWPYCPHTAMLFKTPSIWPDRSKTRTAPGM